MGLFKALAVKLLLFLFKKWLIVSQANDDLYGFNK